MWVWVSSGFWPFPAVLLTAQPSPVLGSQASPAFSSEVLAPPCEQTEDLDPETRVWAEGSTGGPHPPGPLSPLSGPSLQQEMGALARNDSVRGSYGVKDSAEGRESAWVGGSMEGAQLG